MTNHWARLYSNFEAGVFVDWRASDDLWRITHGEEVTYCHTSADAQQFVDAALLAA